MATNETRDPKLMSAMEALEALHIPTSQTKTPAKKKRRKSLFKTVENFGKRRKSQAVAEGGEFEYNWPTCACGMNHPPVPDFKEPDQEKCTYYWQIADVFPFLTLHRALTTEIKFKQADTDNSGVIELGELKTLMQNVFGDEYNSKVAERTFKEIDSDGSGSIDFVEVLTIVNKLVQRQRTNLPAQMKEQYSRVCSIQ